MKRLTSFWMLVATALLLGSVVFSDRPSDAQGTTPTPNPTILAYGTQVSQLQARVAKDEKILHAQATKIKELRTQVADLQGQLPTPTPAGGPLTVSGTGTQVSDSFTLDAGRYKVTARLDVADFSGFICDLYGPDNQEIPLFNELIQASGPWTASTVLTIDGSGSGTFYVSVSNTDYSWSLTFERI